MKVGSLVVCVDDNWDLEYRQQSIILGVVFPKLSNIYTVRGISSVFDSIWLEEIVNPRIKYLDTVSEQDFNVRRFIELDTPTSISIEEFLKEKV